VAHRPLSGASSHAGKVMATGPAILGTNSP
jgi:hypothetical protein